MAAPTFQALGLVSQSTTAIGAVAWPAHLTNDVALLIVESANEAVTLSPAAGFVEITNSPQGTGTAGTAGATRLHIFWARASSSSMASPGVADSGRRQTAMIMTFRGVVTSGNPWDITAGAVQAVTSASVSAPGLTTTAADDLVVNVFSNTLGVAAKTLANLANGSLTNLVERANTQLDGTPVSGGAAAQPTVISGSLNVGFGPGVGGDDAVGPLWGGFLRVPNYSTSLSSIHTLIDSADAQPNGGSLLVLNLAGNKPQYRDATGKFSMALYTGQLDRWVGDAKIADAITRKRIVVYVVDEPNLLNEIKPAEVDQMAAETKSRWPGAITIVRATASTLVAGWGGLSQPPGGYTHVDYAWKQYNNSDAAAGSQLSGEIARERAVIAANNMNMGLCASLNIWCSGSALTVDGVPPCWATAGDGAVSGPTFGYVLGDREATALHGTVVACGGLNTPQQSLIASPAFIKKCADVAAADLDLPFFDYFEHTLGTTSSEFAAYFTRADFVAAFDYAINAGLARTSWNGWRTPK